MSVGWIIVNFFSTQFSLEDRMHFADGRNKLYLSALVWLKSSLPFQQAEVHTFGRPSLLLKAEKASFPG